MLQQMLPHVVASVTLLQVAPLDKRRLERRRRWLKVAPLVEQSLLAPCHDVQSHVRDHKPSSL